MIIKNAIRKTCFVVSAIIFSANPIIIHAESYAPYPDNLPAKVISINSASSITVSAETWPGFSRTFNIALANIEVPQNNSNAGLCEQELAQEALDFTKKYLTGEAKVELHKMMMETSADQNVKADIYTSKGSLSNALKNQGLARPADSEPKAPWC